MTREAQRFWMSTAVEGLLGYMDGRPIWLHSGADGILAGPDDGPDPDDDTDSPDDDDDDGSDGDGDGDNQPAEEPWKPPTRTEWETVREQLRRTTRESVKRKQRLRELLAAGDAGGAGPDGADDNTDDADGDTDGDGGADSQTQPAAEPVDVEAAKREAAEEVEQRLKPLLVREATLGQLAAMGWNSAQKPTADQSLARVLKLIDQDQVQIGDNGIEGLTEQLQSIQEEFPEWFKPANTVPLPADTNVDGRRRPRPPAPKPRTWAEQVNRRLGY